MMTVDILTALEHLNELRLTDTETTKAMEVFNYMENEVMYLQELDTKNTEIMVHCMAITNVFREDIRKQPFTREELLDGAPERNEDSWVVPRLVK